MLKSKIKELLSPLQSLILTTKRRDPKTYPGLSYNTKNWGEINRHLLFILPGNEANNLSMILYLKSKVNIQSIFQFFPH